MATSVIVTKPVSTPTTMISGAISDSHASFSAAQKPVQVGFSWSSSWRSIFRVFAQQMTHMAAPIMIPGTKPPNSSFPTERLVSMAMNTMGMLGGIIGPTTAEAALAAAAKSSG